MSSRSRKRKEAELLKRHTKLTQEDIVRLSEAERAWMHNAIMHLLAESSRRQKGHAEKHGEFVAEGVSVIHVSQLVATGRFFAAGMVDQIALEMAASLQTARLLQNRSGVSDKEQALVVIEGGQARREVLGDEDEDEDEPAVEARPTDEPKEPKTDLN